MATTTSTPDITIESIGNVFETVACGHCAVVEVRGWTPAEARGWAKAHLNLAHGLRHKVVIQRIA